MPCSLRALSTGALLAALLACPAAAGAQLLPAPAATDALAAATARHPERFTLPNGLEVVLEEDHRAPDVAVVVTYRVGQSDDPQGYAGLAHLVEHLMYAGFRIPGADTDFIGQLEAAGSTEFNGTTTADATEYYEVVPAERLEMALWMESGRMAYLLAQLDQQVLDRQRLVVSDEDREHAEAQESGVFSRMIGEALYPEGHPYHRLPFDGMSQVYAATLPAVQWFFQTHYGPENAVLVLVGDFHAADTRALVERYFGPVARGSTPGGGAVSAAAAPLPPVAATTVTVIAPTRLESVRACWPAPPYFGPGDAELDILAHVLAGRDVSRLPSALVRPGLAVDVDAAEVSHRRGSSFEIDLVAAPGHHAPELLHGLNQVLASVRNAPVTDAELRAAKRHWQLWLFARGESLLDRATQLASYMLYVDDPDYLARDLARYESATVDSVLRAARTYLDPNHRVVGLLTRQLGAPRDGLVTSIVRSPEVP